MFHRYTYVLYFILKLNLDQYNNFIEIKMFRLYP
jgi:hypothetical protein